MTSLSVNKWYIFTDPEENNCFSIIAQVIIRATVFSFILLVSFFCKKIKKSHGGHFKISASVARYDVILEQSERMHLYNHLSCEQLCLHKIAYTKEDINNINY